MLGTPLSFVDLLGLDFISAADGQRIVDEAKRLKVKEVIITECGHAYRVMKFLYEAWAKEKLPFKVRGFVELTAELIKDEKVVLKEGNIKTPVTYHDPCQVGRNAAGE